MKNLLLGLLIIAVAVAISYFVGAGVIDVLALDVDPFAETAWGALTLVVATGIGLAAHEIGAAVRGR